MASRATRRQSIAAAMEIGALFTATHAPPAAARPARRSPRARPERLQWSQPETGDRQTGPATRTHTRSQPRNRSAQIPSADPWLKTLTVVKQAYYASPTGPPPGDAANKKRA